MDEYSVFAEALRTALAEDIAEYSRLPDHRFSRRFERRMKKLLRTPPALQLNSRRIPLRRSLVVAVLVVFLALIATGATFAVYKLWEQYRIEDEGLYSYLYISDYENAPKTLKEKYRLGIDLSSYTERIVEDNEYSYMVEYKDTKKNITFIYEQMTKEFAEQLFLNTEDAIVKPIEIKVHENKGLYFVTYYGAHLILWDNGDYILDISAYGIGKDELILIAKSVQKVE